MEPCLTPSCEMGIVREAIDQQDGNISQTLCTASSLRKPHWDGQNKSVVEGLASADIGLSNTEPAVAPGVEICLQEEWPEQQSSCCKKRHLEAVEEELLPKQLRGQEGEIGHVETLDEPCPSPVPVSSLSTEVPSAIPAIKKHSRGRKPRKKVSVRKDPIPKDPKGPSGGPGPSENGSSLPVKVPKKRGRKSKEELLLLRLAQGLDSQSSESLCQQKSNESLDSLETMPGGRPKRRAAKAALLYLQELAEELTSAYQAPPCNEIPKETPRTEEPPRKRRGRKPKEQKLEKEEDVDFVPSEESFLQEEEEEEHYDLVMNEAVKTERESSSCKPVRSKAQRREFGSNGLHNSMMGPIWKSLSITHRLREQHHSHWEFPEWIPSAQKWIFLSESEADEFLPAETKSPLFSIKREGLQESSNVFYRINRFNALQPHDDRLDMTFFVGGPVWALEWCPTPEGSVASQYVAIYCNPRMNVQHSLSQIHTGPALLQLWELGPIQEDKGSVTKPGLAYAIATDHGCIWDMKFCPSGAWELPITQRKLPHMSRLGLLAVAFSSGKVLLYSLPHVEDLNAYRRTQVTGGPSPRHVICKVQYVATLQVGSIQAGNSSECGQCFSLAWMPTKPHEHLAAGFYDGTVALWNLLTKSLLQRVRQPDGSLKLYPFRCFLAHDHAVSNIQWCKANSNFMVTTGNDRKIKFWDLRRLHEPINSIKRYLSTEIAWLLPYSGITVAQDSCYASYGLGGIHYLDAGYRDFRAYFVLPRKGTVWSISGSDWLNTVAAGDIAGELVAAVMPDLSVNPQNVKRPSDRRFLICKAVLQPNDPLNKIATEATACEKPQTVGKTCNESVGQNVILFQDSDLTSFKSLFRQKPLKRMPKDVKEGAVLGRMQLETVHKVRFSPNLDSHTWIASGGQSGLVRLHCVRALVFPRSHKLLLDCQAHFSSMFDSERQIDCPTTISSGVHSAVS
ncbi:general transcription factor 3C polypeptide 2 isoform X2 [Notechis scutatus]|uniref:General transcription factor 3C polypeptide 2 n=1 Tax=Notechis scutatus TaxID=8663 RepID=A0A6J1UAL1_9SAUR|nr:general transcription factor 3C polypeptide 2 isoform X2 [Notechis scutatus]